MEILNELSNAYPGIKWIMGIVGAAMLSVMIRLLYKRVNRRDDDVMREREESKKVRKKTAKIEEELVDALRDSGYDRLPVLLSDVVGILKDDLASTFSWKVLPRETEDSGGTSGQGADDLLTEMLSGTSRAYFLEADSGNGKSVLAQLLAIMAPDRSKKVCYYGPRDTDDCLGEIEKIKKRWEKERRGPDLIVLDALNEIAHGFGEPNPFADHETGTAEKPANRRILAAVESLKNVGVNCKYLFIFRKINAEYKRQLVFPLKNLFGAVISEIVLRFDPGQPEHCRFYQHLFDGSRQEGFTASAISRILTRYTGQFPGYTNSRESAQILLSSLREPVECYLAESQDTPDRLPDTPPWDLFLEKVFGNWKPDATMYQLGRIAYVLIHTNRYTQWVSYSFKGFDELEQKPDANWLKQTAAGAPDEKGALRLEIEDSRFRFPDETGIHILAALYIAWTMYSKPSEKEAVESLQALRGRSEFDVCGKYVIPAYRMLWVADTSDEQETACKRLHRFLRAFLEESTNPSYSFCAEILNSNWDFEILSRVETEELSTQLITRLVQAIHSDRCNSCLESIEQHIAKGKIGGSIEAPNPILDQLFTVFSVYKNTAVDILIGQILLKEESDTDRSQGAYMTLHWLQSVFEDTHIQKSQDTWQHISTILTGFREVNTRNPHIRFHILEVLEFLAGKQREIGEHIGDFDGQLRELFSRFAGSAKYEKPIDLTDDAGADGDGDSFSDIDDEDVRVVYTKLCGFLMELSQDLSQREPCRDDESSEQFRVRDREFWGGEKQVEALQECAESLGRVDEKFHLTEGERSGGLGGSLLMEQVLECYEVLLGLARRVCSSTERSGKLRTFIEDSVQNKIWIVRWWAYHNMRMLIVKGSLNNPHVEGIAEWLAGELFNMDEPMGLKYRQIALYEKLLFDDSYGPDELEVVRAVFENDYSVFRAKEHKTKYKTYLDVAGAGNVWTYVADFESKIERMGGHRDKH